MKQTKPIEVFFWPTPNGTKATVMLEELGVPYDVTFVDIGKDEQWAPEFGAISPNHQIPAIRDPEGPDGAPITVFESGAILLYLGRKFGRFYPEDPRARVEVEQWLFWQVASFGPFLGQAHHFNLMAPDVIPYAVNRYKKNAVRLYTTLDARLDGRDYVAAGEFSIADIALYGWAMRHPWQGIDLESFPHVAAWLARVGERPGVQRGMAVRKPGHSTQLNFSPERLQLARTAVSA